LNARCMWKDPSLIRSMIVGLAECGRRGIGVDP
jgi:hypothetical protein